MSESEDLCPAPRVSAIKCLACSCFWENGSTLVPRDFTRDTRMRRGVTQMRDECCAPPGPNPAPPKVHPAHPSQPPSLPEPGGAGPDTCLSDSVTRVTVPRGDTKFCGELGEKLDQHGTVIHFWGGVGWEETVTTEDQIHPTGPHHQLHQCATTQTKDTRFFQMDNLRSLILELQATARHQQPGSHVILSLIFPNLVGKIWRSHLSPALFAYKGARSKHK